MPREATEELRDALNQLIQDLSGISERCLSHLPSPKRSLIAKTRSRLKAWLRRDSFEVEIFQLAMDIQACCCLFQASIAVGTNVTMLRAQQSMLQFHVDQRESLARLEGAFLRMVSEPAQFQRLGWSVFGTREANTDSAAFIHRQVVKIVDICDQIKRIGIKDSTAPRIQVTYESTNMWGLSVETLFHRSMGATSEILDMFEHHSGCIDVQAVAHRVLIIAKSIAYLDIRADSNTMFKAAESLFAQLADGRDYPEYSRGLAYAARGAARSSHCASCSLSDGKLAADRWRRVFEITGRDEDYEHLTKALSSHSRYLYQAGLWEESLDLTREALRLYRDQYPRRLDDAIRYPMVSWTASGEAEVVLTSQREFSLFSNLAWREAFTLETMASSYAALGCYSEARVAGGDALSCLQALLRVDTWYAQRSGWRSRSLEGRISTWVSLLRQPSSRAKSLRDEAEEEITHLSCILSNNLGTDTALVRPCSHL
ncbi:hypothetical protein HGRIS_011152 [Hohenbuehelia grisea]